MNSLIAYLIYATVTIIANKRSESRQSISIQSLALATIYSVIVFLSLFMVDKLYATVMHLKAKAVYKELSIFTSFIFDDMDEKVPSEIAFSLEDQLKENADAYYYENEDQSETLFITRQGHKTFPDNHELGTSIKI